MVAIKDMEMPNCCVTYNSENDNYTACPFYKICEQRETIKTNYKPTDCPLVEIEERKQGEWIEVWESQRDEFSGEYDEWREHKCSICDFQEIDADRFNYCPNCGAEMVGAEDEMQGL